ncbi:MAG: GntR family transcriptional regulator [Acidibacillus sp.]|nr:GntR family transcriptional regulator [Acidibacillus sp.]
MTSQITRSEPLTKQVYRAIKNAILSGELLPGERVVESRWSSQLKVSRSPVREAIRMLTAEYFLTDHEGVIEVYQPTLPDLEKLYEVRLAIEPMAAKLVVQKIPSPHVLTQLEINLTSTIHVLQNDPTISEVVTLNTEFHRLIMEASDNHYLTEIYHNYSLLIEMYGHWILQSHLSTTKIVEEHTAIFEALAHANPEVAFQTMYAHISKDISAMQRLHTGG